MARRGARGDPRSARLGTRGQELHDLAGGSQRDGRPHRRGAHARGPHVQLRRLLHGRLPRHSARPGRQRERRRGERGRHGLLPGRRHDARQQRYPRHVRLRAAAAGPAHRLALPAGRRSADVHPALPPARRRDRPRRRGRGGPAGLGQPVELRAPPAHGERARGRRAARHARLDRAGLAGPPPERAARRGAFSRRRRAGAAQRDAARAVSALGARARRSLRPARARRHPACHDRA